MYLSFLFSFERSCGALAQLGERLLCTQEVSGSIPLGSIESKDSSIVHSKLNIYIKFHM